MVIVSRLVVVIGIVNGVRAVILVCNKPNCMVSSHRRHILIDPFKVVTLLMNAIKYCYSYF
jgi:hypothetical protein